MEIEPTGESSFGETKSLQEQVREELSTKTREKLDDWKGYWERFGKPAQEQMIIKGLSDFGINVSENEVKYAFDSFKVVSPGEFRQALIDAGLPQEQAEELSQSKSCAMIGEEVFISPLKKGEIAVSIEDTGLLHEALHAMASFKGPERKEQRNSLITNPEYPRLGEFAIELMVEHITDDPSVHFGISDLRNLFNDIFSEEDIIKAAFTNDGYHKLESEAEKRFGKGAIQVISILATCDMRLLAKFIGGESISVDELKNEQDQSELLATGNENIKK